MSLYGARTLRAALSQGAPRTMSANLNDSILKYFFLFSNIFLTSCDFTSMQRIGIYRCITFFTDSDRHIIAWSFIRATSAIKLTKIDCWLWSSVQEFTLNLMEIDTSFAVNKHIKLSTSFMVLAAWIFASCNCW